VLQKPVVIFLVPLAYDYIQKKTGFGSKVRCQALADIAKSETEYLDSDCVVVLSAGYTKESPDSPSPKQTQSLAHQQSVFMRTLVPKAEYIVRPSVWGTRNEIHAASVHIDRYCFEKNIDPKRCEILISSNWLHLFRVKVWAKHFMPDMNKRFIEANHRFLMKEVGQESLKLLRDHFSTKYFDVWPY
jgi:predicted transposase YbfD/YdcC